MSSSKKLYENFFSLAFLQGVYYLLPLMTLPYLVRVLGPSNFGAIAFAQSLVNFFTVFIDYGFHFTATKQIAISRKNKTELNRIFNAVFNSKLILLFFSFVVYFLLVTTLPRFSENQDIFLISFGIAIGNTLFPTWFFQGIEKMRFISFLNIFSKVFFTLGIFVFVKEPADLILVPIFNSLGFILSGILAIIIVIAKFGVRFRISVLSEIKNQFIDGWDVFLSTVSLSLFNVSSTFILGIFTNNTIVGYYSSAEKVVNAATAVINPISQAIFPHVNTLVASSKRAGIAFLKKMLFIITIITSYISLILLIYSETIVNILLGNQYSEAIIIVRILSFSPLLIGLRNIFGVQTMLSFGFNKAFSRTLIAGISVNILLAFLLIPNFHHLGAAVGVLVAEAMITILMAIFLWRKRILLRR